MAERFIREIKYFRSERLGEWVAVARPVGERRAVVETGLSEILAINKLKRLLREEGIDCPSDVEVRLAADHERMAFDQALAAGIGGLEGKF
ncbi:MAG TPA: hypothetical protein ENO22_05800 [candidate division Zixibacteria bacterium]|nr:hypothetical protein [candidate division Zixibacteria bacterium]HEQ98837.1 hypothetical protein [candidate division Zixibacteria bacterium]